MVRQKLQDFVPKTWHEIKRASLDAWEKRDENEPFLPDNRRGYARVTPAGLTSTRDADQTLLPEDQYPMHGLGFYGHQESCAQFTTYVWEGWTGKTVQPMQLNQSLQNMLKARIEEALANLVLRSQCLVVSAR